MTQPMNPLQNHDGASLIELLIAVTTGLVVMSAVFETLSVLDRRFRSQQTAMAATQNIRSGLEVWESEVRMAKGTGQLGGPALQAMDPASFEFTANLNGLASSLGSAALPGQTELSVEDARDWPSGKHVVLCAHTRCTDNRLARDGQRNRIVLAQPLTEAFPAGTEISVLNRVRYYVSPDQAGSVRLMRMVDGGANALIGNLKAVRFYYLSCSGAPTIDSASVVLVRIEAESAVSQLKVTKDIAIRSQL
ncbi:MAG: PilW family protein [Nitrospiraceae bacterium]